MADNNLNEEVLRLRSQVAALEQLLDVHEMTVLEQSDRLEQAVELQSKRAAELQTVAQVSAVAASLLETSDLLFTVVDLTKSSFDLYHAHIYLLDESGQQLELAAGAGEVGQKMVDEGWQIALDAEQSLVAQAARERLGVIVNDIRKTPGFMANPLLPDTASEMAVPLIVGKNVLGVLDVQSAETDYFTNEDVNIMTSLASQIAVALQNARQFQQTQRALAETEDLYQGSAQLVQARTYDEILEALVQATSLRDLDLVSMVLVDSWTSAGDPEMLLMVSNWSKGTLPETIPPGTRYPIDNIQMAQNMKPDKIIITPDYFAEDDINEATLERVRKSGVRGSVTLPLFVGDRWIGSITAASAEVLEWSENDVRQALTFAGQAATVVQNQLLYEQTQKALAETEDLYQGSAQLVQARTYDEILEALVQATRLAELDMATLALFETRTPTGDPETILVTGAWSKGDLPDGIIGRRMAHENTPILQNLSPSQPLIIPDVETADNLSELSIEAIQSVGLRGIVLLPLFVGDQWLGYITGNSFSVFEWTEEDVRQAMNFAGQAASVIQNQLLHEQTQIALARTDELYNISQGLNDAANEAEILEALVPAAKEAGAFNADIIYLDLDAAGKPEWAESVAHWRTEGEIPIPLGTRYYLPEMPFTKLWLADPGNPLLVSDVETDTRVDDMTRAAMQQGGTRALAIIPLTRGGVQTGLVSFNWGQPHEFSPQERETYRALIGLASPAVTSRRLFAQTQEALEAVQESETELTEVMRIANMANWVFDITTQNFTFNDQVYDLIGTSVEEMGGYEVSAERYVQEFIHPEDADIFSRAIQEGLTSDDPVNFRGRVEYRLLRGGVQRIISSNYRLEINEQGEADHGIGSLRDITERIEAQEIITKRAAELETVAQVSAAAASLLEISELLQAVVDLTKSSFDLYHAHIYLLDKSGQQLELTAGAGEVGQKMVAEGWKIALDAEQSLVAQAARERQGVIVNDVQETPGFMANPLLPDTASEMAVPLVVGEDVLGVLDVQSAEIDHFTTEDVHIMTTLGSQVAVALQNARQFQQTQIALAETENLYQGSAQLVQARTYDEILDALVQATNLAELDMVTMALFDTYTSTGEPETSQVVAAWAKGDLPDGLVGRRIAHEDTPILQNLKPGQPLLIPDFETADNINEIAREAARETGMRGMALLPLFVGNQWLGFITGNSFRVFEWAEEDARQAMTFTSQAATSIQNQLLYEQTQMALARTDQLYNISQALNDASNETEIIEALVAPAKAAGATSADLVYLDLDAVGKPEWAETMAHWRTEGEIPIPLGTRFYLPDMPLSQLWIANPENILLISDTGQDERIDDMARAAMQQGGTQAVAIIPLTRGGVQTGLINFSWNQPHEFSPQEIETYRALIGLASPVVTSRRLFAQTQEALEAVQESETQLTEIMQITRMANWELDLESLSFNFSDQLLEMLKTTAEAEGGNTLSAEKFLAEFVYPEDIPLIQSAIEETLTVKDPDFRREFEYRALQRDGNIQYAYVQYRVGLENGKTVRVYGSHLDITERRQAEEEVRQAQERAQTILETVTLPMIISRLSDNFITFANEPAAEIAGIPLDELVDAPVPDFFYGPEERTRFFEVLQEQGLTNNFQAHMVRQDDGSSFYGLLSARFFTYQDEQSILLTITDITERIAAQEIITKRAAELATVADVGTRASTILEEQELIETVAQLTQEQFNLYHCHIFIIDETRQVLQVAACGWEADSPHIGTVEQVSIPTGQEQSLVAQAARERRAIIVNDVRAAPNWLPNELLPETRAEMAVPLIAGNQVLGVLDVQADQTGHFTDEDISIMTTLASQVAVALQNANQFKRTQTTLDELTRLQRAMSREGWQAFMTATERPLDGFLATTKGTSPILRDKKPVSSKDSEAAKKPAMTVAEIKTDESVVIAPMNIRGVTIGGLGVRVAPNQKISTEDQEILNSVSEQVALALETARLSEQNQLTLAQTETMYEVGRQLNLATNEEEILAATTNVAKNMGCNQSSLMYIDQDSEGNPEWISVVASWAQDRNHSAPIGMRIPGEHYPLITAFIGKPDQPLLVPDIAQAQHVDAGLKDRWMSVGMKAICIIPLAQAGSWLGLLTFGWGEAHEFTSQEINIIEGLISLLIPTIQSQQLFKQAQTRAQREQSLRQITAAVRGSTDPATIMRTAVRELGAALGRRTAIRMAPVQTDSQETEDNNSSS